MGREMEGAVEVTTKIEKPRQDIFKLVPNKV